LFNRTVWTGLELTRWGREDGFIGSYGKGEREKEADKEWDRRGR